VRHFRLPYHAAANGDARCDDRARSRRSRRSIAPRPCHRESGGTNEKFDREHLKQAKIVVFPDNRTIFGELIRANADVMITDDVEAELQSRIHPELCRAYRGRSTRARRRISLPHDDQAFITRCEMTG